MHNLYTEYARLLRETGYSKPSKIKRAFKRRCLGHEFYILDPLIFQKMPLQSLLHHVLQLSF